MANKQLATNGVSMQKVRKALGHKQTEVGGILQRNPECLCRKEAWFRSLQGARRRFTKDNSEDFHITEDSSLNPS